MTEGKNIAIALTVLFVIGGAIPLIVGAFYDVTEVTPTGIYGSMVTFVDDGISIFTFDIDLLGFLGEDTKTYITDQITGYFLFADNYPVLANGIIIVIFIILLYGFIKALPTT